MCQCRITCFGMSAKASNLFVVPSQIRVAVYPKYKLNLVKRRALCSSDRINGSPRRANRIPLDLFEDSQRAVRTRCMRRKGIQIPCFRLTIQHLLDPNRLPKLSDHCPSLRNPQRAGNTKTQYKPRGLPNPVPVAPDNKPLAYYWGRRGG